MGWEEGSAKVKYSASRNFDIAISSRVRPLVPVRNCKPPLMWELGTDFTASHSLTRAKLLPRDLWYWCYVARTAPLMGSWEVGNSGGELSDSLNQKAESGVGRGTPEPCAAVEGDTGLLARPCLAKARTSEGDISTVDLMLILEALPSKLIMQPYANSAF
jgi:hypothetical protein